MQYIKMSHDFAPTFRHLYSLLFQIRLVSYKTIILVKESKFSLMSHFFSYIYIYVCVCVCVCARAPCVCVCVLARAGPHLYNHYILLRRMQWDYSRLYQFSVIKVLFICQEYLRYLRQFCRRFQVVARILKPNILHSTFWQFLYVLEKYWHPKKNSLQNARTRKHTQSL